MGQRATELDFDRLSWHDNTVYGVRFDVGDLSRDDWHQNLVLDFDHIVEWVCGGDGRCRFRVAPATRQFHHETGLRIAVDWGDSGCQTGLHELSIGTVTREPVRDQTICLDRPYYRWPIELNRPQGRKITFGARGFTQILRG